MVRAFAGSEARGRARRGDRARVSIGVAMIRTIANVIRGEGVMSALRRAGERIEEAAQGIAMRMRSGSSEAEILHFCASSIAPRTGGVAVQLMTQQHVALLHPGGLDIGGHRRRVTTIAEAMAITGAKAIQLEGTSNAPFDELLRFPLIVSIHDLTLFDVDRELAIDIEEREVVNADDEREAQQLIERSVARPLELDRLRAGDRHRLGDRGDAPPMSADVETAGMQERDVLLRHQLNRDAACARSDAARAEMQNLRFARSAAHAHCDALRRFFDALARASQRGHDALAANDVRDRPNHRNTDRYTRSISSACTSTRFASGKRADHSSMIDGVLITRSMIPRRAAASPAGKDSLALPADAITGTPHAIRSEERR